MSVNSKKIFAGAAAFVFIIGVLYLVRLTWRPAPTRIPPPKIAMVDGYKMRMTITPHADIFRILSRSYERLCQTTQVKKQELNRLLEMSKDKKIPLKKRAEYKNKFLKEHDRVEDEIQQLKSRYWEKKSRVTDLVNSVTDAVMEQLAQKYNLNVILNVKGMQQIVLYSDAKLDLTDEAIKEIQKRLQKITTLPGLED